MKSGATTVEQYLAALPPDRREAIAAVRQVIRKNLGKGFDEGMQYGMIGYFVPHSVYPPGYHCDPKQPLPFAGLASQKNHMSLYLMSVYGSRTEEEWLRKAFKKAGKKLDMGKSCVRFKKIEDVPLDVIGKVIKRTTVKKFVAGYESAFGQTSRGAKKKTRKTTKVAAKKTATKKGKAVTRKVGRTTRKPATRS